MRWLSGAHWSTMPAGPISARQGSAVAWTGSELLVWGGAHWDADYKQTLFSDGASFDPVTNEWTVLPSSPLAARADPIAVWTGAGLFVWGGRGRGADALNDAAIYEPRLRAWRTVSAPPLNASSSAAAAVGSEVIAVGLQHATTPRAIFAGARYDSASDTWSAIAPPPPLTSYQAVYAPVVAVGDQLLVLAHDETIVPTSDGASMIDHEHQFLYAPSTDTWAVVAGADQPTLVGQPIWTGREALIPASGHWCGVHSCPAPFEMSGARLAAGGTSWRPIPHGPFDTYGEAGTPVWTGSVLVRAAHAASAPGGAEAWRADTGEWAPLPRAPGELADTAAVWTGRELLFWGVTPDGAEHGYRLG